MEDERLDLLAQVAMWYYEERLDQAAIAERIDKSRSMVSRLLDQARAKRIGRGPQFTIPCAPTASLKQRLCQEFELPSAHVLAEPPEDYQLLLKRLGELGARSRPGVPASRHHIGLSWGTGVHAVVRSHAEHAGSRLHGRTADRRGGPRRSDGRRRGTRAVVGAEARAPRSGFCPRRCWSKTSRSPAPCAGSEPSRRRWRSPRRLKSRSSASARRSPTTRACCARAI